MRIGKAISSALVRSDRVWSLTSLKLGAKPPIPTSKIWESIRSLASSAAAPPSSSTSWVARWPVMTSDRPSSAISGLSRRSSFGSLAELFGASGWRDQRRERVDGLPHEVGAAQLCGQALDLAAGPRALQVEPLAVLVANQHDDPRGRVVAELLAQEHGRPFALRRAVGEAGGLQVFLHASPDDERDDREDADQRQHRLGPVPRQQCYALDHLCRPPELMAGPQAKTRRAPFAGTVTCVTLARHPARARRLGLGGGRERADGGEDQFADRVEVVAALLDDDGRQPQRRPGSPPAAR